MKTFDGRVIKSISGFYDVEAADGVYTCKCKGSFRNKGVSPVVGDYVTAQHDDANVGSILQIHERKNILLRPPVANVDKLIIIASADNPKPNLFLIDKMTAIAVSRNIEPIVVFTKADLADCTDLVSVYEKAGIRCLCCSAKEGQGLQAVAALLTDGFYVLTGNSGVGKSSLLNALAPSLELETNEISYKLGRGKHTTRCVTIYHIGQCLIADTPGFSSVEAGEKYDFIKKESLEDCFPEFAEHLGNCKFTGCSHVKDKGCAVLAAVSDGLIPVSRHESYVAMYDEVKDIMEWQLKKDKN